MKTKEETIWNSIQKMNKNMENIENDVIRLKTEITCDIESIQNTLLTLKGELSSISCNIDVIYQKIHDMKHEKNEKKEEQFRCGDVLIVKERKWGDTLKIKIKETTQNTLCWLNLDETITSSPERLTYDDFNAKFEIIEIIEISEFN